MNVKIKMKVRKMKGKLVLMDLMMNMMKGKIKNFKKKIIYDV